VIIETERRPRGASAAAAPPTVSGAPV